MKKGKTPAIVFLFFEIAAIAVLHAVKINQAEKPINSKEVTRNISSVQPELRMHASYALAIFR